jgi:hypothetical protein
LNLRGAAWAGDYTVRAVDVSIDFGASWQRANVNQPKNRYDWQRWTATLQLPSEGYYEMWSRATDSRGIMQPHVAGNWNPPGYGANPMHRIRHPGRIATAAVGGGQAGPRARDWLRISRPRPAPTEKYFLNFSFSSRKSSALAGASFFAVMFGHVSEYWRLSSSHFSSRLRVGLMASTGHSGSHTRSRCTRRDG